MKLHPVVAQLTGRIQERSAASRQAYLAVLDSYLNRAPSADRMGCANVAHALAAIPGDDRLRIVAEKAPNIGIVNAYNDMLSAHQPLAHYPDIIKDEARRFGATAQVAGGVPAMCDGVTQGTPGMELSLFSRDTIAMATAVSLSHDMFDAALMLGVCDKIVPGLLIGALHFGHLPTVFVPAGPMPSGLSNNAKAKVREQAAQGLVGRGELLQAEQAAYHAAGTCTFYGTANSNQMLMEIMGLHLPGTAFVPPGTALRESLTRASAQRVVQLTRHSAQYTPVGHVVDERAVVNGIVGLLATGGSTNHTLHLVAIARAAGIVINWDDFDALSNVVPLLARVYPNGSADVNAFQAAGGVALVIRELLGVGLLHADVRTVAGPEGLWHYTQHPVLHNGSLTWVDAPAHSGDPSIIATAQAPFSPDGGLRLLQGNLGRAVIKVSAVKPAHRVVEAPALVLRDQHELQEAYQRGELNRDLVAVVLGQGPRANGMPELHALTPLLTNLQDQGFKVALVTDGRMSGASGKVPAAIHVTPEVLAGGPLGKVRTGDLIRLDADAGTLQALVPETEWAARTPIELDVSPYQVGTGRELFAGLRQRVSGAEQGAMTFGWTEQGET